MRLRSRNSRSMERGIDTSSPNCRFANASSGPKHALQIGATLIMRPSKTCLLVKSLVGLPNRTALTLLRVRAILANYFLEWGKAEEISDPKCEGAAQEQPRASGKCSFSARKSVNFANRRAGVRGKPYAASLVTRECA